LTAIQFRAEPGTILTRRFEEATSLRLTRGYSDVVLGILCARTYAYIRTVAQLAKVGVTQMACLRSLVNGCTR